MIRSSVNLLKQGLVAPAVGLTKSSKSEAFNLVSLARSLHVTSNVEAERRDLRTFRMTMNKVKHNVAAGEQSVDIDGFGEQ